MLLRLYNTYNSAGHHPEQLSICPPSQSEPIEAVSCWKLAPNCWEGWGGGIKRLGVFICNSNVQKSRLCDHWRFKTQSPSLCPQGDRNSLWLQQEVENKSSHRHLGVLESNLLAALPMLFIAQNAHTRCCYVKPLPEGEVSFTLVSDSFLPARCLRETAEKHVWRQA